MRERTKSPQDYGLIGRISRFRHQCPVSPIAIFLHGTQAPEFDQVQPGTSLTQDWLQAVGYAQHGAFFDRDIFNTEEPRVIELRVNLPKGAIYLPTSQAYSTFPEQNDGGEPNEELYAEYHRQAALKAKQLGYDAYYSGLYPSPYEDLVIVNPDAARIYRQNVLGPRGQYLGNPETQIHFDDLPELAPLPTQSVAVHPSHWVQSSTAGYENHTRGLPGNLVAQVMQNPFGRYSVTIYEGTTKTLYLSEVTDTKEAGFQLVQDYLTKETKT